MSTLWTPGGEHHVPRQPSPASEEPDDAAPAAGAGGPESLADIPGYDELTPEEQARAQEMARELAEARERIAQAPAAEVVANHVMGLYELAAIHLSGQPPALEEAQVAIDAMSAVVNALPGRLGANESVLRDALQQLQMAFVQLTNAAEEDATGAEAATEAGDA